MNPSGIVLAIAGVWVLTQTLAGGALQRLGLFAGGTHRGWGFNQLNPQLNPTNPGSPTNPTNPGSPLSPLNPASPLNPFAGVNLNTAPAPPAPAAPSDVISA